VHVIQQLKQRQRLGLPRPVRACLFDLDGVLTETASLHAVAWKRMFDAYLRELVDGTAELFAPFDPRRDYDAYVDGKPRFDGVRDFLASRGLTLPEGTPSDPPNAETVHGLGSRKNQLVLDLLRREGVEAYPGSLRYLCAARAVRVSLAVVSASTNMSDILAAAGIGDLFEVCIDGRTAAEQGLQGKPAPDTFLAAARALAVEPAEAAVFEDALAGVAAGRAGGFGVVVGVDRVGHGPALRAQGADLVVSDLADLLERP
jgi:beta-phosphoglucomutase family hydrolase